MAVVFVSDAHFGRGTRSEEREKERQLISFVELQASELDALFLVGDLFDDFIEYRHVAPKGHFRLLAFLSELCESRVPVTYVLGNHDPWHIDLFRDQVGTEVVEDVLAADFYERRILIAHGDQAAAKWSPYALLRPMLRHPVPIWLYRNLLPVAVGYGLALAVKARISSREPSPETVARVRAYALERLATGAADSIVVGHSHQEEIRTNSHGTYVNAGEWDVRRTAALLDGDGFRIVRVSGGRTETILREKESLSVPIV